MFIFERETWSEVYYSLSKNKLRTILTMIGVAWGMFLYIFLLGAAKGVENGFNRIFDGFATNSVFLWASYTGEPYKGFPRGRELFVHVEDADFLEKKIHEIDFIVPRNASDESRGTIIRGNVSKNYSIFGDHPKVNKVEKKELIKGRFINEGDIKENKKVAVIGKEVAKQLFKDDENPIGQYIRINKIYFQIVGVYRLPNPEISSEALVYIPFNTFQQLYNTGSKINWMVISIKPQYDVKIVENKVKEALKEKYNVSPKDERAFGSFNFAEQYKKMTGFLKGMQLLTWVVGSLTILAGVIAISNILLITVKERTLEIGIRRALGAKPSQIREQILLESIFLTVFSGLLGFILGVLALLYMNSTVANDPSVPFYNPTVNIINIVVALSLMVSLGLIIGLIPAQRAVQIKPIEALRTE